MIQKINKHLQKIKINVLVFLPNIDQKLIEIFKKTYKIPQIKFFITNNFTIDLKKISFLKNINLIITNDIETIKLANNLNIKTIGLLNKETSFDFSTYSKNIENNNVKIFYTKKHNQWENPIVKTKFEIEKFQEIFLEETLLNLLRNKNLYPTDKILNLEHDILSILLFKTGYKRFLDRKLQLIDKLLKIYPNNTKFLEGLAYHLSFDLNKKQEAEKIWEKFIELDPERGFCLYAFFLFSQKKFDEFFKYLKKIAISHYNTYCKEYCKNFYTGNEEVKDKSLLIFFDKGFGDTFCFSAYIKIFQERFKNITCAVPEPIYELIKSNFENNKVKIISKKDLNEKYQFDYGLSQLGLNFQKNPWNEVFINHKLEQWIHADKEKINEFKKYFSKDKFNIGIFWESQKIPHNRNTTLETLLPLAYLDNVQLYSLQIEKEDFEINYLDDNINIVNLGKHFKDFSDTAAAIENCDLIVTTDSSVMNLAGAMGKKTFALFNEIAEWRWYKLEGDDIGWYKSIKPFHTNKQNDFSKEIEKICEEIKNLVEEKFNT